MLSMFLGLLMGNSTQQQSEIKFILQEGVDENSEKAFYASDSDKEEAAAEEEGATAAAPDKKKPYVMDADHRLLLRTTKPLLNSRNASVSAIIYRLLYFPSDRVQDLLAKGSHCSECTRNSSCVYVQVCRIVSDTSRL